jgi:hypothetical protein
MVVGSKQLTERTSLRLGALLLVLLASSVPLVSDQKRQVVVVSVNGEWTLGAQSSNPDGTANPPVRFGQTLTAGDLCLVGEESAAIVLKYSTPPDDKLYPFPCEKRNFGGPRSCTVPDKHCGIDLHDLNASRGIVASLKANILDPMLNVIRAEPEKYMVAASRGADSELADAVVPFANGHIDLRAIFREMSSGTYYVELSPVDSPSSPTAPLRIAYSKGQPAPLAAGSLRAGVYKVLQVTEKGEHGDSDCWVLIAAPPAYASQAAAYAQAASEAAHLPAEMDPAATRGLLRAYLESLSRPEKGETHP